jgi:hypothetical protein
MSVKKPGEYLGDGDMVFDEEHLFCKTEERTMRLTNLDISDNHRGVKMCLMRKDFTGQFARWVVEQSPYPCPNITAALVAFDAHVLKIMDGEEVREFSYDEVSDIVSDDVFEKIPAIMALNKAKIGSGPGWQSRYDKPHPDYDFIDLGALARNIFYSIIRHHINWADEEVTA